MDSDARASKRLFFIGTNNYQAGVIGGQRLAKELHDKGNVVVFTMPEQANLQDRLRGYRDALEGHPQIKITQVVDIKGDPRVAFDSSTQMVGKEKDKVDAFVCLEAQAGKEVATVLSTNKVTGKVIVAMDTDPDTLDWIKKGVIAATISQKPYTMASVGLRNYQRPLSPQANEPRPELGRRQLFAGTRVRRYRIVGLNRQKQHRNSLFEARWLVVIEVVEHP